MVAFGIQVSGTQILYAGMIFKKENPFILTPTLTVNPEFRSFRNPEAFVEVLGVVDDLIVGHYNIVLQSRNFEEFFVVVG